MPTPARSRWALLAAVSWACSNPTGAEPTRPGPPGNLAVAIEERTDLGNGYDLTWTAPSGASVVSYLLEAGATPGTTDLEVTTGGPGLSFSLRTDRFRGPAFVRVRARNDAGSSEPSNEVRIEDQRDIVEALFLSTGTLKSPVHQPICQYSSLFPDIVNGFPRGTVISASISAGVSADQRAAAVRLFDDMTAATGGALRFEASTSTDRAYMENAFRTNQWHGVNGLIILDVDDGTAFCGALGCGGGRVAQPPTAPLFVNAFVVVQRNAPASILAHELGHAVGLCHVAPAIMDAATLMGTASVDRLSGPELAAVRSFYRAGLGAGSSRGDIRDAGMIGAATAGPVRPLLDRVEMTVRAADQHHATGYDR